MSNVMWSLVITGLLGIQANDAKYGTFEDTRYEKNKETNKVEAIKETYWTTAKLDRIFDHIKMREIKKKIIQRETSLTAKKKMELAKINKELNGLYRERDKERHNIIVSWNNTVKNNPGMSAEEIAKRASVRRVFKGYGKFMVQAYLTGTTAAVSILVPAVGLAAFASGLTATTGVAAAAAAGALQIGGGVIGGTAIAAGAAGLMGAGTTAIQMAIQNRFDKWIKTKEAKSEMDEWADRDKDTFMNLRTKKVYVKDKHYYEVEAKKGKRKFKEKQEGYFTLLKKEIARIQDGIREWKREYDELTPAMIEKLRQETENELKKEKKDETMNILMWSAIAGGVSAVFEGATAGKAISKAAKLNQNAKVGSKLLSETINSNEVNAIKKYTKLVNNQDSNEIDALFRGSQSRTLGTEIGGAVDSVLEMEFDSDIETFRRRMAQRNDNLTETAMSINNTRKQYTFYDRNVTQSKGNWSSIDDWLMAQEKMQEQSRKMSQNLLLQ